MVLTFYKVPTDEKDSTGVEGTMQYLQDLGVNLENAEILLVCEIVQAPVLGELSKQSFIDGWKAIGYEHDPSPHLSRWLT